jgi:hypothetical protein
VLDLRGLPPQITTSFVLTPLDTVQPLPSSITGVHRHGRRHGLGGELGRWADRIEDEAEEVAGRLLDQLGDLIEDLGRHLEILPPEHEENDRRRLPRFEPTVYTALPSTLVEIRDVVLQPGANVAALLRIENRGDLAPGSDYNFQVQQFAGGNLVGGSAYKVRIAGDQIAHPFVAPSLAGQLDLDAVEELEREAEDRRYLPPWMKDPVDQSEKNLGKSV